MPKPSHVLCWLLLGMSAAALRAQAPAAPIQPLPPPAGSVTIQGAGMAQTGPQRAEPSTAIGPGGYYEIEPGDTVTINFRFTPEFNDEVVVTPDGHATLKAAGDIKMAGMTVPELQRLIVRATSAKLVNPEVTVSLKDFQRPQVVVAGEVATPLRLDLRRPMTATQAILMAGGAKEDAALGKVLLFRRINSEYAEVHVLQLGRYDARTRAQNDMILEPDDLILVRRDAITHIERFVKLINLGVYLNPIGNNGIF